MSLDQALFRALTGLPGGGSDAPLTDLLAADGWDRGRLAQHVDECRRQQRPWPHPVSAVDRPGVGAAQFHAALNEAMSVLGLVGSSRPPAAPRPLDAAERRLLAEVPPHHGS